MIPIKLTFEGVYSYRKRQTIDFTRLIDTGLFGVFGKVGSGKSSILEALTFALYGQTERLNARGDNRNYNMMNLKSNESLFDFEFFNFKNDRYRIVRQYRRNSKKFEDVSQRNAVLYQWIRDEWIPLESVDQNTIEKVVGLSYDNFKRTIIIPQGKFREFIELAPTQRTHMLKEVFNLHRFDLNQQAREMWAKTINALENINGQLLGLSEINKNQVLENEKKISKNLETLKQIKEKETVLEALVRNLSALMTDIELLNQKQNEFKALTEKEEDIEQRRKSLEEYERTNAAFGLILAQISEKRKQKKIAEQRITEEKEKLNSQQENLKTLLKNHQILEEKYKNIQVEKDKTSDYELALSMKAKDAEISELTQRKNKGTRIIADQEKSIEEKTKELSAEEKRLKKKKESRIDAKELLDISEWYQRQEYLTKEISRLREQINTGKDKLKQEEAFFEQHKLLPDNWETEINKKEEKLKADFSKLDKDISQLRLHAQLEAFTKELKEGNPCPLCGSSHHPNILEMDDVTEQILILEQKKKKVQHHIEECNSLAKSCARHADIYHNFLLEKEKLIKEEADIKLQISNHRTFFKWSKYDPENSEIFINYREKAQKNEEEIKRLEDSFEKLRAELKEEEENLIKYKTTFYNITSKLETANALRKADQDKIKTMPLEDFDNLSTEALRELFKKQKLLILQIETDYEISTENKNKIEQDIQIKKESIHIYQKQIEELGLSLAENEKVLEEQMERLSFTTEEEIQKVLAKKIDVENERKEIEAFILSYSTLQQQIADLSHKLEKHAFHPEEFKEKEKELNLIRQEIVSLQELNTTLQTETRRMKQDLEKKEKLEKEKEKLETKREHVSTIVNLMRGNGFVNYASGVWLQNLVYIANNRFHRMTKNQLSLELNTENEFEVIDYLNEGKRRSVKTLSGGQTFQVALSLALALAESVQSMSSAKRNFFFIDEGFGTQDSESVNVIFETLNNLRKEGKVVGIISHVESLQEQIPVTLYVEKTEAEGSQILET